MHLRLCMATSGCACMRHFRTISFIHPSALLFPGAHHQNAREEAREERERERKTERGSESWLEEMIMWETWLFCLLGGQPPSAGE